MEIFECKYCKSKNLVLESRVSGENVLTANMVALKCADCGKWIKWCPKEERHFYIKEKESTFTFTQQELNYHDIEVRKQERQDIFMELNELKNYFDKRFNDFENNYEDETFSNIDMSNCYLDASSNLEYILEKLNEMKEE